MPTPRKTPTTIPDENIPPAVPLHGVVTRSPHKEIVRTATDQDIIVRTSEEGVGAISPLEVVVPGTPLDGEGKGHRWIDKDGIIPGAGLDRDTFCRGLLLTIQRDLVLILIDLDHEPTRRRLGNPDITRRSFPLIDPDPIITSRSDESILPG